MRQILGLAIGLGAGIAGAVLFMQSLPPEEGSAEDRAETAESELHKARTRIAEFEAEAGKSRTRLRDTSATARSIGQDIRDGRPVNLDDVFQAAKPWLRDLAPVFDRVRVRDQKRLFDEMLGGLAREYNLTESQQKNLKDWLDRKAEENAKSFSDVVMSEKTGLEDMIRASRDFGSRVEGLDQFMEGTLRGEALARFKEDRLQERADTVQREADRKVQRLSEFVELDEAQKDRIFVLMARGSPDFDPSMQFEGLGADTGRLVPGQSRDEAVLSVLRPEQRETYEEVRRQRLEEARKELSDLGLTLPDDWNLFDEDDF